MRSLSVFSDSVEEHNLCLLEKFSELSQFFLLSCRRFSYTSFSICVWGEEAAAGLHITPSIKSGSTSGFILKENHGKFINYHFKIQIYCRMEKISQSYRCYPSNIHVGLGSYFHIFRKEIFLWSKKWTIVSIKQLHLWWSAKKEINVHDNKLFLNTYSRI